MSLIFTNTIDMSSAATPSGYLLAYDTDGILKQKNNSGEIFEISNPRKYTLGTFSLTASLTQSITHNLNTQFISVTLWNTSSRVMVTGFTASSRTPTTVDIIAPSTGSYDIIILS